VYGLEDKLPKDQIFSLISDLTNMEIQAKQIVVQRIVVNSFDIMYALGIAKRIADLRHQFSHFISTYIQENKDMLLEFEDLQDISI
jgi:hypothetical protein